MDNVVLMITGQQGRVEIKENISDAINDDKVLRNQGKMRSVFQADLSEAVFDTAYVVVYSKSVIQQQGLEVELV